MGSTTARLALPYPANSDANNVPGNFQSLATRLDGIVPPFQAVASLPAAGNQGFFYLLTTTGVLWFDTGTSLVALNGPTPTVTLTLPATYSVNGPIAVTSGATEFLPPMIVPVVAGQTVGVVGAYSQLRSGSATVAVSAGGAPVAGLGALAVSTTLTYTAASGGPVALSNGEPLQPSVSAASGSPDGLTITLLLAYTASVA